jgi:hypothetical protein
MHDDIGIGLNAPARNIDRLADVEMLPDPHDARHGDARAIAEARRQRDAAHGIFGIVEVQQAFGVQVEGEAHRAASAVRPGGGFSMS